MWEKSLGASIRGLGVIRVLFWIDQDHGVHTPLQFKLGE